MHRNHKAAFTLIELLVVIAILAILAAILFPVFARVREKGRQAVCLSNLKQLGMGVMMYIQDYDETFPFVLDWSANERMTGGGAANIGDGGKQPGVPGATGQEPQYQLVTVVAPYVKNPNIWHCPSVGPDATWDGAVKSGAWKKGATMRDQGTTYLYTYLSFPFPYVAGSEIFMGGKSHARLLDASRWPMLSELPNGWGFTGNLGDPPASVVPHSGGMNVAYGDGHAKFYRTETADGGAPLTHHIGDGLYPGQ
jgi:prepilin-type N-terminal cleavage/methylation domain-containing protein/prepilin-type processing-associated H-X9-DG protein